MPNHIKHFHRQIWGLAVGVCYFLSKKNKNKKKTFQGTSLVVFFCPQNSKKHFFQNVCYAIFSLYATVTLYKMSGWFNASISYKTQKTNFGQFFGHARLPHKK